MGVDEWKIRYTIHIFEVVTKIKIKSEVKVNMDPPLIIHCNADIPVPGYLCPPITI